MRCMSSPFIVNKMKFGFIAIESINIRSDYQFEKFVFNWTKLFIYKRMPSES